MLIAALGLIMASTASLEGKGHMLFVCVCVLDTILYITPHTIVAKEMMTLLCIKEDTVE